MSLTIEIKINNSSGPSKPSDDYITWSPAPCKIITNSQQPLVVNLKNKFPGNGKGQVVFIMNGNKSDKLQLTISARNPSSFHIAGRFDKSGKGHCSSEDKDTVIELTDIAGNRIGEKKLMVRVRKNADRLTTAERDRFLRALVKLKNSKVYDALQEMHNSGALNKVHYRNRFLPWHRAFLLDLERNLQKIDPSVTIPYWNFDEKAPFVFTGHFIGQSNLNSNDPNRNYVGFANTNPLITNIGFSRSVDRVYTWHPEEEAISVGGIVQGNEIKFLLYGKTFKVFGEKMESNPHINAHSSFTHGSIQDIAQSPKDPLFFLLHANIDRIWAKWQWINNKFDPANIDSYPNQGNSDGLLERPNIPLRGGIGDAAEDELWPWKDVLKGENTGGFPDDPLGSNKPGPKPNIKSMLDFQGSFQLENDLHFAYDDVPFYSKNQFPLINNNDYRKNFKNKLQEERERKTDLLSIFFSNETVFKRLEAFSQAGIFQTRADIKKAYDIFENTKENIQIRACALKGLYHELSGNEEKISELIKMLNDTNVPEVLRRVIFQLLKADVNGMPENLAFYLDELWKMVYASHTPADIREEAISILVFQKDPEVRQLLINEIDQLSDKQLHADKKMINPVVALQLLSYDIHSGLSKLFQRLATKENPPGIRIQAIRNLSTDMDAMQFLKDIFNDTNEHVNIRITAATALNAINPRSMVPDLKRNFLNEDKDLNLKIALLNILTYIPLPSDIKDTGFVIELEKIAVTVNNPAFTKALEWYRNDKG